MFESIILCGIAEEAVRDTEELEKGETRPAEPLDVHWLIADPVEETI